MLACSLRCVPGRHGISSDVSLKVAVDQLFSRKHVASGAAEEHGGIANAFALRIAAALCTAMPSCCVVGTGHELVAMSSMGDGCDSQSFGHA